MNKELPSRCTWKDCKATGYYEQIAKDGSVWARLCETHDEEIQRAIESRNAKRIISSRAKALRKIVKTHKK